jgi:hypothetical protein
MKSGGSPEVPQMANVAAVSRISKKAPPGIGRSIWLKHTFQPFANMASLKPIAIQPSVGRILEAAAFEQAVDSDAKMVWGGRRWCGTFGAF